VLGGFGGIGGPAHGGYGVRSRCALVDSAALVPGQRVRTWRRASVYSFGLIVWAQCGVECGGLIVGAQSG
jgi:hypothetical protein